MKCFKCGVDVPEGNKFCPQCGAALYQQQSVQQQQPVQQQYYGQPDMVGVSFGADNGIPPKTPVDGMAMQAGMAAQLAAYDKSVKWSRRIALILLLLRIIVPEFSFYYSYVMKEYAPYGLTSHGFSYLFPTFLKLIAGALIGNIIVWIIIWAVQWYNRNKMQKLIPVWVYWIVYALHLFIAY